MEFHNDAQRRTYELVGTYLDEIVSAEGKLVRREDVPGFRFLHASALVSVVVTPVEDTSVVYVAARVVTQPRVSPELYEFLVRENDKMLFGAFSMDDGNDILFRHNLYGETLDREELKYAVGHVGHTADRYDDIIRSRFGGLRAADY